MQIWHGSYFDNLSFVLAARMIGKTFSPEISGCGSSLHPTRRLTLSLIILSWLILSFVDPPIATGCCGCGRVPSTTTYYIAAWSHPHHLTSY